MGRRERRAAGRGTRDGLTAAFEKVYLSDSLPSFQDFLDLGRELAKARLQEFIGQALHGPEPSRSYARNLLYTAARIHQGLQASDTPHLEGLIRQVNTGDSWLHVRDEIIKFYKMAREELEKRAPPSRGNLDAAPSESGGLNRTDRAVLSIIKAQPKGQGVSGKEILKRLKDKHIIIVESTLRKHVLPKLMKHHGVVNHKAAGGYLVS